MPRWIAISLLGLLLIGTLTFRLGLFLYRSEVGPFRDEVPRVAQARQANLAALTLGPGWTLVAARFMPKSAIEDHGCYPDSPAWGGEIASYLTHYSYLLDSNGLEFGHLSVRTSIQTSTEAALEQQRLLESEPGEQCLLEQVTDEARREMQDGIFDTTIKRVDPPTGEGHAFDLSTRYQSRGPLGGDVRTDLVIRLQSGRMRARIQFERCCSTPPDPEMVHSVVAQISARLAEADASLAAESGDES